MTSIPALKPKLAMGVDNSEEETEDTQDKVAKTKEKRLTH
jgi:hypothetical protein